MFTKKTKWMPLGNYSFDGTDYIVFVRGNKKNGMMEFKTRVVQPWTIFKNRILPTALIDTQKQWDKIMTELQSA